jgi:WXG100 family type VII secretion target
MDPELMRTNARELESLRQRHLQLMRKMRILMANLSDIWSGEAQNALERRFLQESQSINELSTTLESYITVIHATANHLEQVEQQLAQKAKQL